MAITQDEMQSIITAVLSAIRTNSRTIGQLTPVTTLSDDDSFEIDGGKRVTYAVLRDLIASLSSTEQDSLKNLITKCELKSVSITATESAATLIIASNGKTIEANIAPSDLCDILTEIFNGDFTFRGITGKTEGEEKSTISWESTGYVNKEAIKYVVKAAN